MGQSSAPCSSILDPLLFLIFINYTDRSVVRKIQKCANDIKLCGVVESQNEIDTLKNDLRLLIEWSEERQISFNAEKM